MSYKPIKPRIASVSEQNAPKFVIGRDQCVKSLWEDLESSSLRLLAERRMGKTWIIRLALAKKPDWAVPLFFDAEKINSSPQFVWLLNKSMYENKAIEEDRLEFIKKWYDVARRLVQQLQGQSVGKIEIPQIDPWDSLLEDTFKHLVKRSGEKRPVLIIDELPLYLDKLIKSNNSDDAIQLLDTLRAIRQEFNDVRMVFCGSLGLHVILDKLRRNGYTGSPYNNMPSFEVHPLAPEKAQYLAGCLLLGADIECTKLDDVATAIAEAGCGVPFYIQHMVMWMQKKKELTWNPEKALSIPDEWFQNYEDPANLAYFNKRLDSYYSEDQADKARSLLNVLSKKSEGMPLDELINLVRHHPKTKIIDKDQLGRVLDTLYKDHYIIMQNGRWRFKLEIIRKWWWERRGKNGL